MKLLMNDEPKATYSPKLAQVLRAFRNWLILPESGTTPNLAAMGPETVLFHHLSFLPYLNRSPTLTPAPVINACPQPNLTLAPFNCHRDP